METKVGLIAKMRLSCGSTLYSSKCTYIFIMSINSQIKCYSFTKYNFYNMSSTYKYVVKVSSYSK